MERRSESVVGKTTERSWGQIVFQNFSATMVSSVVDSALRFLAYGYLARQLGPEMFGINSFMYTTTFFFGSFSDFGLRILGAREIAAHPDRAEEQVSATLSLKIVFMVAAYALMQVFVFLTRGSTQVRTLALIYGLSLFGFNTADWILMGLEQMHYLGIAKIIHGVGVFTLALILVRGPEDLLLVGLIESFTFLLAGLFLLYVASRKVRIYLSFRFSAWKTLLREAFPLGVSLVMTRFGSSLPVLALGLLSSDYEVGIYRAVSLLPSFVESANTLLAEAMLPTLSRIYVQSEKHFVKIVTWTQKYLSVGGVLFSILGILLAEPILPLVFGEEFLSGLDAFQVLMLNSAVIFSYMCLRRLLPAHRAQQQYAAVMTVRTGGLLILSMILSRRGSTAQAWAVLVAEVCALGLSVAFFQKQFPASRLPWVFLKIAISGGVMTLIIWLLNGSLLAALSIGLAVYALMLLCFGAISIDDFGVLKLNKSVFQRIER